MTPIVVIDNILLIRAHLSLSIRHEVEIRREAGNDAILSITITVTIIPIIILIVLTLLHTQSPHPLTILSSYMGGPMTMDDYDDRSDQGCANDESDDDDDDQ